MAENFRYFKRVNDNPEKEDYQEASAITRFLHHEELVISEVWDVATQTWVDFPDMIAFTGIGGDEDYQEINKSDAAIIMNELNDKQEEPIKKSNILGRIFHK